MSHADESRLAMELDLLTAMFPEQMEYSPAGRDLKFAEGHALLHLRLPEHYPESGFPDVMVATDSSKNDMRNQVKAAIPSLGLEEGMESLDAIIACFQQILETNSTNDSPTRTGTGTGTDISATPASEASKIVIIWLHHLLALGKRKLALSPAQSVSGITKPGYPGVMVFTGPQSAVDEHVNTLKAQNWQAFQVRYEGNKLWKFAHGVTVREVETMAEVAKAIEAGDDGARRKEEFLKAVGIK